MHKQRIFLLIFALMGIAGYFIPMEFPFAVFRIIGFLPFIYNLAHLVVLLHAIVLVYCLVNKPYEEPTTKLLPVYLNAAVLFIFAFLMTYSIASFGTDWLSEAGGRPPVEIILTIVAPIGGLLTGFIFRKRTF